jgi:hypothetical protein
MKIETNEDKWKLSAKQLLILTSFIVNQNSSNPVHVSFFGMNVDGECILAGGKSKFVWIYHVFYWKKIKFQKISVFMSWVMTEFINRRYLTEFGNLSLLEQIINSWIIKKFQAGNRGCVNQIFIKWAVKTTEGLMLYSLDETIVFSMSLEVSPKAARALLDKHTRRRWWCLWSWTKNRF